jgi:hypothetical protein
MHGKKKVLVVEDCEDALLIEGELAIEKGSSYFVNTQFGKMLLDDLKSGHSYDIVLRNKGSGSDTPKEVRLEETEDALLVSGDIKYRGLHISLQTRKGEPYTALGRLILRELKQGNDMDISYRNTSHTKRYFLDIPHSGMKHLL